MRELVTALLARLRAWWTRSHRTPSAATPPPPTARPAGIEPEPRPVVTALLWLAPLPGGHEIIEASWSGDAPPTWASIGRPATTPERNALLLDRFESLYADAERAGVQVDLWLACRPVREQVLQFAASFPHMTLRTEATGPHRELRRHIEAQLVPRQPQSPAPRTTPQQPRLVVATDASAGLHGMGIGIACVTDDGRWAQEYVTVGVDSTVGELLAIDLALRTFPDERLHVLTDSQRAMRKLADPALAGVNLPRAARRRLASAVAGRRLTLQWVRGHNGHPLNETADRLAMAARRGVQLNQGEAARQAVAQHIVGGLLQPAA